MSNKKDLKDIELYPKLIYYDMNGVYMDAKDMRFVKTFLEAVSAGKVKLTVEELSPSDKSISERADIQWSLCTNLMILNELGAFKEFMEIAAVTANFKDASAFIWQFGQEVLANKLGVSKVGKTAELAQPAHIIRFFDHQLIKEHLTDFKKELLKKIDIAGGITQMAKKTGLSQPSLSRMFNTNAVPRTKTLEIIFNELKLDSIEILKKEVNR